MDASVKRYQELLRLIEAKYEFGKVASVEPLQAQQSLLSARNSLLDCKIGRMWPARRSGICSISAPVRTRPSAMPT